MELRTLEVGDIPANRRLMNHAFGQGRLPTRPKEGDEPPKLGPEDTFGLFDGAELQASLTICPFNVVWGAHGTRKMGGIAGVATWAHARGQGHVDRLLVESLVRMREAGQSLSALYPFAWSFYRKYGWDWVGERWNLDLPLRELPKHRGEIRLVGDKDEAKALVQDVYRRYTSTHHGPPTTETRKWDNRLEHSDNKETYVYASGSDGYLLWHYGKDGDAPGHVREMLCTTPDAERALLGLLRDFGMQSKIGNFHNVPSDHTLRCHLAHWDVKATAEPVFAARVVDVEKALTGLKTSAEGALTIAVSDSHAPWNDGVFTLEASGGETVCKPAASGQVVVELDIQALSQGVWGHPSLGLLRRAGRVTVHEESGFELLSQILAPATVWHPAFF